LLVRYGGEEFAVLLPDADLEEAKAIAERLRAMIAETQICCEDISLQVTISIGITPAWKEETLENLIREASGSRTLPRKGTGTQPCGGVCQT